MFVYLGKYKNYFGPYTISGVLSYLPIHDRHREQFGDWLAETWVNDFCHWLHKKRKRIEFVHIHNYDAWNMDSTLSIIILPLLKALKDGKYGAPLVDDIHVPDEIKSTNAPPKENEWDIDDNHFKRWEWVLGEMIWSFEQLNTDWEDQFYSDKCYDNTTTIIEKLATLCFDDEGYLAHSNRIDNGLKLFGIYYRSLWS